MAKTLKITLKTKIWFGMFRGRFVSEIIQSERGVQWLLWANRTIEEFHLTKGLKETCLALVPKKSIRCPEEEDALADQVDSLMGYANDLYSDAIHDDMGFDMMDFGDN